MAKRLEDTIRKIVLSEAGPDSIPGRLEPKPEFDELGGPIVRNDQEGIDFSKPIKPGQAALPKQGGGGPERNPTKYKKEDDLDPKKVMGEEEEKDEDDDDKLEEGSRLPGWLKSKLAEETDEDEDEDEDDDEKKEVSERYVQEEDDEKDEDDDDEEDVKEEKEEDDEEEGEKEVNEEYFQARHAEARRISEEALGSLFEGKKLNESVKEKLATIFEAAVEARAEVIREEAEARYSLALEQSVKEIAESVTSTVDGYLDYVVEQWLEENTLAVENGIRSELTESFIAGLKNVFEEHYIDIPEKKVKIVEALAERTEELEGKLNNVINENISLKEEVKSFRKANMIREATSGMTESQASKVRQLAEGLDFDNAFSKKLEVLKESTTDGKKSVKKTTLTEDAENNSQTREESKVSDPLIEQTKQILGRYSR